MRIPAASIDNIDLQALQQRFPDLARDIAQLGRALSVGQESVEDIARLGRLLNQAQADERGHY